MKPRRPLSIRVARQRTTALLRLLCILGAAVPGRAHARALHALPTAKEDMAPPTVTYAATSADAPRTVAVPIPGSSLVRGKSTITMAAPIDKVRAAILDFAHYPQFMPHYKSCKVLGHTASGARDVYMEVAAAGGLVTMWARVEVGKPTMADGAEVYETKFVEGNVKDLKATWRFKKIDDASTEVTLEVFVLPKLPLPNSVVNQENLGGSAEAVLALKKRLTGK